MYLNDFPYTGFPSFCFLTYPGPSNVFTHFVKYDDTLSSFKTPTHLTLFWHQFDLVRMTDFLEFKYPFRFSMNLFFFFKNFLSTDDLFQLETVYTRHRIWCKEFPIRWLVNTSCINDLWKNETLLDHLVYFVYSSIPDYSRTQVREHSNLDLFGSRLDVPFLPFLNLPFVPSSGVQEKKEN